MHKDSSNVPSDGSTIRWGKRAQAYAPVPEWVLLADLTPQAKALYALLLAHVNRERKDGFAWPVMDSLATMLGFKHRNSISKYIAELAAAKAIDVERNPGFDNRNNVYLVNEIPPDGYAGAKTIGEFYEAHKSEPKTPMHTSVCVGMHTTMGVDTHTVVCHNQTNQTTRIDPDEVTSSDAVAAIASKQVLRDSRKIFVPRDFNKRSDGDAMQYLVSAAIASMDEAGLVPHPEANDRMGVALRERLDNGVPRSQWVEDVRHWVQHAGTEHEQLGWLASPRQSEAA